MTDRDRLIRRGILATAVALVVTHYGSQSVRSLLVERLKQLCSLIDAYEPDDMGRVVMCASRVAGVLPPLSALGDAEHELRVALQVYFAGQSNAIAIQLGLIEALP